MDMLSSLRELGVALLLDDFDMGFSPPVTCIHSSIRATGSHPADTSQKKRAPEQTRYPSSRNYSANHRFLFVLTTTGNWIATDLC